jgi:beta-galactosidase beta subunit
MLGPAMNPNQDSFIAGLVNTDKETMTNNNNYLWGANIFLNVQTATAISKTAKGVSHSCTEDKMQKIQRQ